MPTKIILTLVSHSQRLSDNNGDVLKKVDHYLAVYEGSDKQTYLYEHNCNGDIVDVRVRKTV